MKVISKKLDLNIKAQALVLGEFDGSKSADFKKLDKHYGNLLSQIVKEEDFKFSCGRTLVVRLAAAKNAKKGGLIKIILLGLGKKPDFHKKKQRKALAAAIRKAKAEKIKTLAVNLFTDVKLLVETAILVTYDFNKYKGNGRPESSKYKNIEELTILSSKKINANEIKEAQIIGESTCLARDLVWEPACTVTPSYLASIAKKIKAPNLKVNVLDKAKCKKLGMGAYLAVAQGSNEPPKFIEITYAPKGKIKKHIALVGKGVTFDSGGLSLKPSKAMEMMKEDMSGAAGMLGVMNAVSKLKPKGVKITMVIAATENMPSGDAYRPGDVITAMNGKTIEVNNTDAEGRLTLADAVNYVSTKNPDEIIDMATLTGACMVALGNVCAGMMTNDQKLLDRVKKSADAEGELMWQLPLYDEYKESLKSSIADYINAGSGGKAGAQNGGLFVGEFVGNKKGSKKPISWLHLDIAGPCWLEEENEWSPKGASGIGVRTLTNYILNN